jgi:hypothetical protein
VNNHKDNTNVINVVMALALLSPLDVVLALFTILATALLPNLAVVLNKPVVRDNGRNVARNMAGTWPEVRPETWLGTSPTQPDAMISASPLSFYATRPIT